MEEPENEELVGIIRDRIRVQGKISFVEFMDLALYHPRQGYYQSSRERIGSGGDYYTSPHIHPVFGALLSRQLHQMWEILGHPASFTVVEMGAGKGLLCFDILTYCRSQLPDFYKNLRYLLAEIRPVFRDRQKSLLYPFAGEGKVEWVQDVLDGRRHFTGCALSNELIDAFPVHLIEQEGNRLREIYVTCLDEVFGEVLGEPSTPFIEEYLRLYGSPLQEGQRGEVNLRALEWVEGVSRVLERGFVLTLDYGYLAPELYHPRRREGTLLCYFRHSASSDPYRRVGRQDITAHVNFTALIEKGEALGLEKAGYTEQYRFLVALGLLQELENLEKDAGRYSAPAFLQEKLAMRNFLVPGGMGTLFKVLAQSKGVRKPGLLGFQNPFDCKQMNNPRAGNHGFSP